MMSILILLILYFCEYEKIMYSLSKHLISKIFDFLI